MAGWWERFAGRLEFELEDFRARDLDFELDEALFRDSGRVLLRGGIEYDGRRVVLEVLYPDLFPYLRPEVYAPGLKLGRHQTPLGNLCLLDRPTHTWKPGDTAAWLVAVRVPLLLSLFAAGPEAMVAAEAPQGEPASAYVMPTPGAVVFVPAGALELDPALLVGSGRLCFSPEHRPQIGVRALLCELVSRPGGQKKTKILARAEDPLARRFGGERLQMRWVRLQEPPANFDAQTIFDAAEGVQSGFGNPPLQRVVDGEVAVTGVIFPEEVRQGVMQDTWVFAVRWRRSAGRQVQIGAYVLRGERLTSEDLGARIPRLASLPEATIAQVGLGALGAPLALELARNQIGTLRLLESELVEAAQIVRWPLGLPVVGRYKLMSMARFIEQNYPYTQIEPFLHQLGQTARERHAREENELDLLDRLLDGASLIVDASAEIRIQQLLGDFARERGLTQLFLSATEGARGGHVVLIVPGADGCWYCWKAHALDGTIPLPPSEPGGTVQPRGCATPTFTGTSFDLLPIVAQAARVAATAVDPTKTCRSTVWVCALPADGAGAPHWSAHPIPVHPECPFCASEE